MYKLDLALNKLQWLISHKTKPNQIIIFYENAKEATNLLSHKENLLCKWMILRYLQKKKKKKKKKN